MTRCCFDNFVSRLLQIKQRNKDFHRIVNAVSTQAIEEWKAPRAKRTVTERSDAKQQRKRKNLRAYKLRSSSSSSVRKVSSPSSRPLNETFDAAIVMGDFNYRLDVNRAEVVRCVVLFVHL